jgi:hypothetical protein
LAGKGEEGAAGAQEIRAVGASVLGLEPGEIGAAGEVVRDGGEELRGEVTARLGELRRGDAPAVVESAAQGDDGEPGGSAGVRFSGGLARRRVEGLAEPRSFGVEAGFELQEGVETGESLGGGQRFQGLDGKGCDAQQGEPGLGGGRAAQGAPPPSCFPPPS